MIEALLKSDQALNILTTISLAQFLIIAAILIGIGIIIFKSKDKIKAFLEDYREEENHKEDLHNMLLSHDKEITAIKKHHEEDIQKFYNSQLNYRQQSLNKQDAIDEHFESLEAQIKSLTTLISNHYEETKRLKRNELREKLLNSYRHFTSKELNPSQEWNEMEAEAFWHLFSDYEEMGGNGYMHSTVKPAMEALIITKIS